MQTVKPISGEKLLYFEYTKPLIKFLSDLSFCFSTERKNLPQKLRKICQNTGLL